MVGETNHVVHPASGNIDQLHSGLLALQVDNAAERHKLQLADSDSAAAWSISCCVGAGKTAATGNSTRTAWRLPDASRILLGPSKRRTE
jgi:hypothetical protein